MLTIVIVACLCVGGVFALHNKSDTTIVQTPNQTHAVTPSQFIVSTASVATPTGTNFAKGALASGNGNTDIYVPAKAVDGSTEGSAYWEGNPTMPDQFTVTMNEAHDIGVIRICLNPSPLWQARTQTFSIQTSVNGTTFTDAVASADYNFDPKTGNVVLINLPKVVNIKAVRLNFTKNTGAKGAQIGELELYTNAN